MKGVEMMRLCCLLVFVGWLLVWVLLPTKTYMLSWTPRLTTKLNSSYFQTHGTNLLLFSFPIMFIASLGSVYLHFHNKSKQSSSQSCSSTGSMNRLSLWKRPAIVMAPLGIVTTMELAFAAMFVALLIWSLANYLDFSFNGHLHMDGVGEKVWQAKFRSVSLRLGYIGNICWAFLFFPVTRGSSLLALVGLTSESSIKYHIWLGHVSMVLFAGHSIGFIIYWAMTNEMVEMLEWSRTYVPNIAGEIAFVVSLAMWATSFPRVRRKMFEVFFYTHHLYVLYIFFYVLHVGAAYFCMILPGIFLFLIDRYLRFLQSRRRVRLISARVLPCDTVELNFSKSPELTYNPTSILFLNVPSISKLQWHPFTVNSNSSMEHNQLSVVVKCLGKWSHKLYQQISSSLDHLEVSTEGPYGPISSHFLRHECVVMISGGSGITPFISIIREVIFQSTQPKCKIPKILLVAAFKSTADLTMLDLILPISGTMSDLSKINLQIDAYVTGEEQPHDHHKPLQTLWFKPNPSDLPITSPLGPNAWLWLSAIITSSFLLFLLFLGVITRYHIYPTDEKAHMAAYNFSLRTIWDMFLVCACVFICASVVFLRQSKEQDTGDLKIQNLGMSIPTISPGLGWSYNGDDHRELESLPHQTLAQSTNVHFGTRPDLKRILFECKESDVGVLVCGPRKMRHEVAKICSAGLAKNLHFEAISFNW